MTRLSALSLSAIAVLAFLAGCQQQPDPNAKKVLESCLAVSAADATAAIGQTLTANKMSGDDAPRSICAYNDAGNNTYALVEMQSADKIADHKADMASDLKMNEGAYKGNVKPVITHDAAGYEPGSFYLDITPAMDQLSVQLHTFVEGYKLVVVVNNSKDFPTAEKQADAIAKKVVDNIKSGAAFQAQ